MSETIVDDDDQGAPPPKLNGHSIISAEELQEALGKEREARIAAERARKAVESTLATEREGRTRAERTATDATAARFGAEEQAVNGRLEATEAALTALERDAAQALAEGNFSEAAKIQRQMARFEAKIADDERYKAFLATEKQRAEVAASAPQGLDLSAYSPAKRAWIREHPEFMEDVAFRGKTTAGHHLAIAEGHKEDSPEYFETIERLAMGKRPTPPAHQEAEPEEEQPRQRTPAMAVERRTPSASPRQDVVRLTAEQREAADTVLGDVPVDDYMKDGVMQPGRYKLYHRQNQRLRQQGRIS